MRQRLGQWRLDGAVTVDDGCYMIVAESTGGRPDLEYSTPPYRWMEIEALGQQERRRTRRRSVVKETMP